MVPKDKNFKILKIRPIKGSKVTKSHLSNLGFVEGALVKVVHEIEGNLIVSIKDSRIAIGKDIANKIMLEEVNDESDDAS